ncbi:hypothetical protein Q4512_07305 [Oceanihabitans sp. 2_MG-2023]|uniref:hypothetical protein n=1 Tax=Oceanihabitans sp. 2_MG-2023 TaxID=3062661 RepID=UPI0026E3E5EA|nr:hypothetical protein [Oceanihabitans sp. 2_MG-2023]MDO6596717.1 hypothetical protein [Oceanihabitans sp. 2_MG-2023]
MNANNNIQEKIDSTLKAATSIEQVTVSPFFKDKTMQRLFSQKEEENIAWSWFSPKLQFATLVCVVAINVIAFTKLKVTTYDENVNQFAESYGLSVNEDNSLLN